MSSNRASRGSNIQKSASKRVSSTYSKTRDNFKARDKPKYKSGTKPKNSTRDRGIENPKRRRPNNRENTRSEGYSNRRTSYDSRDSSSSRSSGRPSSRSGDRRSGGRSGDRSGQEFKAVCSACKKETTLPFKPTGSKPVYCRDCFQDHKPRDRDSDRSRRASSDRPRQRYDDRRSRDRSDSRTSTRQDFDAVCSSCKKEMTLPFKPTGVKPVYCRECFKKVNAGEKLTPKSEEPVERFGDREGPYRENKRMHKTHCRQCNELILVPFKPKKNKLIYCQDCYAKISKEE